MVQDLSSQTRGWAHVPCSGCLKPLDCQGSPRYLFILFYLFGCSRSQLQHSELHLRHANSQLQHEGSNLGPRIGNTEFQPLTTREVPPYFSSGLTNFYHKPGHHWEWKGFCERSGLDFPRNTSICDHHFTGWETEPQVEKALTAKKWHRVRAEPWKK